MTHGRAVRDALVLLALAAAPLRGQCPDGSPPPCGCAAGAAIAPTSLADLYFENASHDTFENASHDTADAYLADGITEEIISRLSEVGRLQVKSRYRDPKRTDVVNLLYCGCLGPCGPTRACWRSCDGSDSRCRELLMSMTTRDILATA